MLYNFSILQVDNGGGSILSYTWTDLIQGRYQFSVIAFTSTGQGEAASLTLTLSTLPNNGKFLSGEVTMNQMVFHNMN